jgi:TRAP-type C4-dicarboxylate transport system permease small subunit
MYFIAGVALTAMMCITVADVILRTKLFKSPIVGTYEIVGLLGAIVIAFSIPYTSRVKGHVVMDFLTSGLPRVLQSILLVVTRIVGIGLFVIIAWQLWSMGNDLRRTTGLTLTLQIPLYPVAYAIAVCAGVECLVLLEDLLRLGKKESDG